MLSRSCNYKATQRLGTRNFFDYVKVANKVDEGVSLEEQRRQQTSQTKEKKPSDFSWKFIDWFQEHTPEAVSRWSNYKNQYSKFESYVARGGETGSATAVDFSKYRNKVADPKFVDELEIQYHVTKDTLSSIDNMKTLFGWAEKAMADFKKECEDAGYLLWEPLNDDRRREMEDEMKMFQQKQVKIDETMAEFEKDFEQLDAERMLFNQNSYMMKLSQHPQFAEHMEDLVAQTQTATDNIMHPYMQDEQKRRMLSQIQDENRRKAFLERYEKNSAIQNGLDKNLYV